MLSECNPLIVCVLLGAQADEGGDEGRQRDNLTAVMESMGIYDTDLRARGNTNAPAVNETQRLLKILLATLNKAVARGSMSVQSNHGEPSTGSAAEPEPDHRQQSEPATQTNYTEVRCKLQCCYFAVISHTLHTTMCFLCLGGHGL